MEPPVNNRRSWLVPLLWVSLVLLVVGVPVLFNRWMESERRDMHEEWERYERERFAKLVAEVRAGKSNGFSMYDTRNTDEKLKSIVGLKGLEWLGLSNNHLTPAGMESVAKLPDLNTLEFYFQGVTDAHLEKLKQHPGLEELIVYPFSSPQVTVPCVLGLPHLKKLSISILEPRDPSAELILTQLEQATMLRELKLLCFVGHEKHIAALREKLPNCIITTDVLRK